MNKIFFGIVVALMLLTLFTYAFMDLVLVLILVGAIELRHKIKDSAFHDYLDDFFNRNDDDYS